MSQKSFYLTISSISMYQLKKNHFFITIILKQSVHTHKKKETRNTNKTDTKYRIVFPYIYIAYVTSDIIIIAL